MESCIGDGCVFLQGDLVTFRHFLCLSISTLQKIVQEPEAKQLGLELQENLLLIAFRSASKTSS
jgi:hypothetical protein